jgi:hypothetical protein
LGILSIPYEQIEVIGRKDMIKDEIQEQKSYHDPNQTRFFLMPSANTLPAGKGYIADYELVFFTTAVGVTDWLMINGGFLLLPIAIEKQVLNFGFKARLFESPDKVSIAAGWQFLTLPDFKKSPNIGYAVVSLGDEDRKLNIGLGGVFGINANEPKLFIGLSGDSRISEHIKIIGELWVLPETEYVPLVLGLRFFGSNLSGDIGLLYPLGESLESPIGIPVVNLVYNF